MGMSKLWESKKKIEQLNRRAEIEPKIKYEDRYRRITIYLKNEIYNELQVLRKQGHTQTAVINVALTEFLEKDLKYPAEVSGNR